MLRSPTDKSKKPGPQPAQDSRLSQAAPPSQAEESSDSSSSSDSEEETPKQPPKPGQFSQGDALSAAGQAGVGQLGGVTFMSPLECSFFPSSCAKCSPLEAEASWWQSPCTG